MQRDQIVDSNTFRGKVQRNLTCDCAFKKTPNNYCLIWECHCQEKWCRRPTFFLFVLNF